MQFNELASFRNDARIAGIDTVDIREDVAPIRSERRCQRYGGSIRASAAERGDSPARPDTLKSRHDGDLTLGQAPSELGDIDLLDAGFAVHAVGAQRNLPAEPRARIDPQVLQSERQQTRSHLFAGGDYNVVLARIAQGLTGASTDELVVTPPSLRRRPPLFPADFALDPPGNIFDAVDIGERGATKFLNYATHVLVDRPSPSGEPLQDAFATRDSAYIVGAVP
jgi:hypothetical protein